MKFSPKERDRVILGTALSEYKKPAESTEKSLELLALPTMAVQEAIGNAEVIASRFGTSDDGQEVELTMDLIVTAKDALDFYRTKCDKVKKDQLRLSIATYDTDHTVEEIQNLRDEILGQNVLALT